ncbi:hypothetical protein [Bradyrhizobium sp.]|uniref:hypothetical protein n=1 Tax=Bradyrhizobium sp. TaxID=376 RepID=UPI003C51FC36
MAGEAARLREQAKKLPPGGEQILLLRKVRQIETALRVDAWLASPEGSQTSGVISRCSRAGKDDF